MNVPMRVRRRRSIGSPLTSFAALIAIAWSGGAGALPISSTDLWNGATVNTHSGVRQNSDINDMFGASLSTVEVTSTLFRDGASAGTVHSVEWQTSSSVTLRSFVLNAAHDGVPADANERGFSNFKLYAFDGSVFSQIFSYNPANPYSSSLAPPNGVVDPVVLAGFGVLSLGVNIVPVTTDRFRAEFVQFGDRNLSASGPRIQELDGFDTFLSNATIPETPGPNSIPEPHALALIGLGLAAIGFAKRRRLA